MCQCQRALLRGVLQCCGAPLTSRQHEVAAAQELLSCRGAAKLSDPYFMVPNFRTFQTLRQLITIMIVVMVACHGRYCNLLMTTVVATASPRRAQ
eukprot:7150800-Alexandrium_andersonii.AAC.1